MEIGCCKLTLHADEVVTPWRPGYSTWAHSASRWMATYMEMCSACLHPSRLYPL